MTENNRDLFYSGTSNLLLPVPNKLSFPPEYQDKSRLTYYSSLFNTVEINSSFYKIPRAVTVKKWAESVSKNFKFTFKLWREITHTKGFVFTQEDVRQFINVVNSVGDKKGCLLVQFPPKISIDYAGQLGKLLETIQQANNGAEWKVAVEFRNRSWYQDDVYDLLAQFDASLVLHDMPSSATPFEDIAGSFVYLRFHGPNGGYRGSYNEELLYEYAQYINDWRHEGKDVYVYFNNSMGEAVKNLITLNGYVNLMG